MSAASRIIITGFMGAGKTTVARALARRLNYSVIDLDQLVAEREGRSVPRIIDEDGEQRFREAETLALRDALENNSSCVIALGGGTWTLERNRALVSSYGGWTVWLDAPFELCWQRIKKDGDVRPLARGRESALVLYNRRRALYEILTWRIEVCEGKSADHLAAEIADVLLPLLADNLQTSGLHPITAAADTQ